MMGGRLKAITLAVRTPCAIPNVLPIIACTESVAARRSSKGFRRTAMKPALGSLTVSRKE